MASSAVADGTLSVHTNASTAIEEDEELETSYMEKAIMLACEEAWKAAGGAHKYLCQQYDSPESRQAFTDLLVKNLPFLDGVCYHTNGIPPSVQAHEVCQKPAMQHLCCVSQFWNTRVVSFCHGLDEHSQDFRGVHKLCNIISRTRNFAARFVLFQ